MRSFASLIFLLVSISAMAGDADSLKQRPLRYVFTINSAVLLCASCASESSSIALPTTIHGIQVKRWRLGAGIGYTSFGPIRAMPYFGSVTYNLYGKKRKNGFFVEYNYGGAHAWLASVLDRNNFLKDVEASGFSQVSLGYALHYEKLRIAAQAGFQTLKTLRRYEYGGGYFYPLPTQDFFVPPNEELVEYETNRFFVAISIGI